MSLIPSIPPPDELKDLSGPFIVGLIASPERVSEIRRNRMLSLNSSAFDSYIDADLIKEEMAFTNFAHKAAGKWLMSPANPLRRPRHPLSLYMKNAGVSRASLLLLAHDGDIRAYASRLP